MPARQAKAPPLQTKEEIEREKKPTTTCSMGMKMTIASNDCWRTQVAKEDRIREDWKKVYQPEYQDEEEAARCRVIAAEQMKAEERANDPLRSLLLDGHSKEGKGRKAYLAERLKMNPQDKQGHAMTVNQTIGWDSQRYGSSDSPLATQRHLFHSGHGRGAGGAVTTSVNNMNGTNAAGLGPQSLQNSSAVSGSMGTVASHGKARSGEDILASIQSISYDGKSGTCKVISQ